ncbi:MAG: LCP family protein [Chloroflexi bacterium]|nr:LCP family protein [Chloroflexota bacterium]
MEDGTDLMQNDWTADDKPTLPHNHPVEPDLDALSSSAATLAHNRPVSVYPSDYYSEALRPPPPPPLNRESAARERMRRRRVRTRRGGEWAWVVIAAAMLGVVVIISMSAFILLRAAQTEAEFVPTAVVELPTPVDARRPLGALGSGQQLTLSDGRSITLTPWDGVSRFTVLLMGLDRRPGETGLAYRTDTIMLASIDPATNSLGILSIPRDLYVEVPGYSELQRINSPMVLGELRQPGYGPQLMMQTTQYNLGIRVHDYLAVDFNTVITLVDAIGGIDIDVPYTINDPQYPDMNFGYDPLFIRAGLQHMDGRLALKYARTRHGDSDFQRAERQQQVLYAVRDKVLSLDILPQLIIQSPTLWGQLNQGVSTGLTLDQIIQLAWYLKDVSSENIRTGVINEQYTAFYTTPAGASVLVPDRSTLGALMVDVFGQNYSE